MLRLPALRFAAALFAVMATAATAAPALAQGAPAPVPTESAYAAVLRTINPKLPAAKARAYARSVMADAWRTHLDPRFIMSIVTVESAWHANAESRVGARGLGQLMPSTAARLRVNAWSAADNLRGTAQYLRTLVDRFHSKPNGVKLAIAGYNAGPKAVERYHGVPPYAETQNYVVRVLHVWNQLDARVGRAFAPSTHAVVANSQHSAPPDVQQWLTSTNNALPATAEQPAAPAPSTTIAAPVGEDSGK
jgi:soluble lytic murein transglycosylase-like protein